MALIVSLMLSEWLGEEKVRLPVAPTCASEQVLFDVTVSWSVALSKTRRRVLGDIPWVTPLLSGTKEAVPGKGDRIAK